MIAQLSLEDLILEAPLRTGHHVKDITGQRFGRLTVIGFGGVNKHSQALWRCKCDCGNEKLILGGSLRREATKSCDSCYICIICGGLVKGRKRSSRQGEYCPTCGDVGLIKKQIAEKYEYCIICKLLKLPQPDINDMEIHHINGDNETGQRGRWPGTYYSILNLQFPDVIPLCKVHHREGYYAAHKNPYIQLFLLRYCLDNGYDVKNHDKIKDLLR
jgi:hypothetical protein